MRCYTHPYAQTHTNKPAIIRSHTRLFAHAHARTHARTHAHTHTRTHAHTHTRTHASTHARTHTRTPWHHTNIRFHYRCYLSFSSVVIRQCPDTCASETRIGRRLLFFIWSESCEIRSQPLCSYISLQVCQFHFRHNPTAT